MTFKHLFIPLLMAGLCLAQNGGNDLFQQGLRKERSEGDYKGALEIYRRVLKQYASDRKLASRALLEIAHCQERLGSKDARQSYERLIREFGDQPQAVAEARSRITALAAPVSSAPRVRQLWAGREVSQEGSVSPDGRSLTYPNWDTGDLGVRDLVTGTNKLLTNTGGWEKSGGEFAQNSRYSPDGKRIAYNWFIPKSGYELRMMNWDGSGVQTLGRENMRGHIVPLDWSPDGTSIFAYLYDTEGLISLHLVTVASGERRELMSPRRWQITGAKFSPDGRRIVLDGPGFDDAPDTDIYTMPVTGGPPEKLETNPAIDASPYWTSDGSAVLFVSNRGGSFGLWRLPVSNAKASGTAQLIRGDLGAAVAPIGSTRDGSLVYKTGMGNHNVYSVDFDARAGKTTSEPTLLSQRYQGRSIDPELSPDGKRLAFLGFTSPRSAVVVIREQASGKERVLPVPTSPIRIIWTPDSGRLLLEQVSGPNSRALLWLDPVSGSVTPFQTIKPNRNPLRVVFSLDGGTLYFLWRKWPEEDYGIYSMDVSSGQQRELYKTNRVLAGLSLSPDGRNLATVRQVQVWNTNGMQDHELVLQSVDGGPAKVAVTFRTVRSSAGSFTPDGKKVMVMLVADTTSTPNELATIELNSGKLEAVGLKQKQMVYWTLDPSGAKLLFSASTGEIQQEVWIAENILPQK